MPRREGSRPRRRADAVRFSRTPGVVVEVGGGGATAWTQRAARHVRLNETAALLWQMCDGSESVDDLCRRLGAIYPGQAAQIAADVRHGLAALRRRGLIEARRPPRPARPLLSVAFASFWPGFDPRNNYFTAMLGHRFDVVLVDAEAQVPQLLFYSTRAAGGFDHRRADRALTRTVFVDDTDDAPDFAACDFAVTTGGVDARFAERHQQLPLWCLYLDWQRYERAEAGHRDRLPKAYQPAAVCRRLADWFEAPAEDRAVPEDVEQPADAVVPRPSSRSLPRKLTIGMATFDDYDGAYFTALAIRLFHPEVTADTELLLIDNHPDGPCSPALQRLAASVDGCHYVASDEMQGTAARDLVFREARSPYAMCVDSHVMFAPGALRRLIDYMDAHPDSIDLLQGPLVRDDLSSVSTHFAPEWSRGMYGRWETDARGLDPDAEPFEIAMQGLGVFACRREAWRGFNPRLAGFGAEEGYIHEKFRRAGGRVLCLPFLRWTHRFERPFGTRYRNLWKDRIRNYLIAHAELGLDTTDLEAHFRPLVGEAEVDRLLAETRAELANPFSYFDAIYCINLDSAAERWRLAQERFRRLGILHRVRRFSAVETPESHHIGCALSHRGIIARAEKLGLGNVLVLEDDALFLEDCAVHLERSIAELRRQDWGVFHLGGHRWGVQFPPAAGCRYLDSPCRELTCTHAVAYHASAYGALLADLPADVESMREWLTVHRGIDQYLRGVERRYLSRPVVASQAVLLDQELPEHAGRFF